MRHIARMMEINCITQVQTIEFCKCRIERIQRLIERQASNVAASSAGRMPKKAARRGHSLAQQSNRFQACLGECVSILSIEQVVPDVIGVC